MSDPEREPEFPDGEELIELVRFLDSLPDDSQLQETLGPDYLEYKVILQRTIQMQEIYEEITCNVARYLEKLDRLDPPGDYDETYDDQSPAFAHHLIGLMFRLGALIGSKDLREYRQTLRKRTDKATRSRAIPDDDKLSITQEYERLRAEGKKTIQAARDAGRAVLGRGVDRSQISKWKKSLEAASTKGKYLLGVDLSPERTAVTISKMAIEESSSGKVLFIWFDELAKPLRVFRHGQMERLTKFCGAYDADAWLGQKIMLRRVDTELPNGDVVSSIAVLRCV
jgi:hypothetical protein